MKRRRLLLTAAAAVCVIAAPLLSTSERTERCRKWLKRAPPFHFSRPFDVPSLVAPGTRRRLEDQGDGDEQQQQEEDEEEDEQEAEEEDDDDDDDDDANNQQANNDGGDDDNAPDDQVDDYYNYDGDEDAQGNADDDNAEAGDDAATDDAQGANQDDDGNAQDDGQNAAGQHDDDYFDDKIADDQLTDDDITIEWDDFYAYQDDWQAPSLLPMTSKKYLAFALIVVASTLGASGGIGGGGITVPVLILVMDLPLKVAVPISAATCLGGGLGSTIVNIVFRRHPLADRPLIDWDLVMVMEPLTLVGTLLGTLFHRVLSEKILVILLVMLLSITAHTTLTKAMRMYHAEKRYIRHLKAAQAPPPSGTPPGAVNGYAAWTEEQSAFQRNDRQQHVINHTQTMPLVEQDEKQRILILNPDYVTLRSDLAQQDKFTPRTKILALIGMMFVLTFLSINPWGIRCGSLLFYSNYVVMIVYLVACAWAAQTYLVARAEVKELVRFDYVHGDIQWNAKTAVLYPAIFVMAGIFAGTLGIGGGVIIVPLLMHFGLHPSVASASSSAMILLTSFSATTSYVIYNVLLTDYAVVGFCLGFCSALVGQSIMRQVRQATSASGRNFERNSYIAFVIGGVVLISALLMTIQYVLLIVQEPDDFSKGVCDGISY